MVVDLDDALAQAFAESTRRYQERGFQRRVGFGKKPALINVDLANAWTRPGNPFTCEGMDERIIPGVQRLLEACRANGHLVVFITTYYRNTRRDDPHTDMGLWHCKMPVEILDEADEALWAIDSRIAPSAGEKLFVKKGTSGFHRTGLAEYLRAAGVDTTLVTGVTATACVRTTACDSMHEGFRTIAVRECIGDRVPGAVAWNLFDLDAKYADVEAVDTCVAYLNSLKG